MLVRAKIQEIDTDDINELVVFRSAVWLQVVFESLRVFRNITAFRGIEVVHHALIERE